MTHRGDAAALGIVALMLFGTGACSTSISGHPASPSLGASAGAVSTPDFPASEASTGSPGSTPSGSGSTAAPAGASSRGSSTSARPSVIPAPATPLRTVTTTPVDGTSYVVQVWARRKDPSCPDHAYGAPMIDFLTKHPCLGLDRELATTTVGGRAVGVSIVTTGFPGTAKDPYAVSAAFRRLVVADGTGSINDLLREGYRLPSGPTSVPTPDAFNAVGQDNGITIYDAWYLQGPTPNNDKALVRMTQDIFLQV